MEDTVSYRRCLHTTSESQQAEPGFVPHSSTLVPHSLHGARETFSTCLSVVSCSPFHPARVNVNPTVDYSIAKGW